MSGIIFAKQNIIKITTNTVVQNKWITVFKSIWDFKITESIKEFCILTYCKEGQVVLYLVGVVNAIINSSEIFSFHRSFYENIL